MFAKIFQLLVSLITSFIRTFQRIKIDHPKNYLVLVTGCDSGFGLLTIYRLIELGYYPIALCLTEEGVQRIQQHCQAIQYKHYLVIRCDVIKSSDLQAAAQQVEQLLSKNPSLRLWAIVNNAGIAPSAVLDWFSMESFRKCLEVNFFGVVSVTKTFLPFLKLTKDSRIINLSSCAGFMGFQNLTAYSASKHAVEGFAKSLRMELLPWNIYVTNINPGFMKTPMVMGAENFTIREYERAPKEITSQYPPANPATKDLVHSIAEDPSLVVNCIIDNLTRAIPMPNNYPGKQAKIFSWFIWLTPGRVMYLLEVLTAKLGEFGPYPEVLEKFQGKK